MKNFVLLCLFGVCALSGTDAQPKYEIRAVWLTTLGGMDWPTQKAVTRGGRDCQKEELICLLDQLQAAHINTVLFQTRLRGDMVYPSRYEPFAEALTGVPGKDPLYDPLQFAVEECHKRGMEIHAWVVTIPVGNDSQVRSHGSKSIVKQQPRLCKRFEGSWYLDPGLPETATYLCKLVDEMVTRYDLDGVHLDYIRYPENGRNFPDMDTYRLYGKGLEKQAWRRQNITEIVRQIYRQVKSRKPWVKVSSSPIGKFRDTDRYPSYGWNAFDAVNQDVQTWLKLGIQDAIFPMMYFQGNQFYPFLLDWTEQAHGRFVVPGLGIYFLDERERNWNLDEIGRQIYFSRQASANGQAFFRNRHLLSNTKGLLDELHNRFYRYPACIPPMTWLDSIAPLSPSEGQYNRLPDGVELTWKQSVSTEAGGIFYRVYGADHFPARISQAGSLYADRLTANRFFCKNIPYRPLPRYWAVTAVDRFGNESAPLYIGKNTDLPVYPLVELQTSTLPDMRVRIIDLTGVLRLDTTGPDRLQQALNKGVYRFERYAADGSPVDWGFVVQDR